MRILIVGNDPHDIGGVANYTRPLATTFATMGHEVHYFYSGAWNRVYDWRVRPYLRMVPSPHPFTCHELVNSPNWPYQFGLPANDIAVPEADGLIRSLLAGLKPDVVHVHSRVGLPGSIFSIAAEMGLPVFNTIHVYGMLCQRRVMVDSDGQVCPGPTSMEKCARCTGTLPINALKTLARLQRTSLPLANALVSVRRAILRIRRHSRMPSQTQDLTSLANGLSERLAFMIEAMNRKIRTNFCVSQDVKATLMRFGVREDKLTVQHIGSVIAERQVPRKRGANKPLVIGNIGGIAYYKGTHVLVEAAQHLQNKLGKDEKSFEVDIHGAYTPDFVASLKTEFPNAPVKFHGRYKPDQLPEILDQLDVIVLPSICADTAPQTIFESFSRGVPVVASNIGGFPDFVRDRENGRLFPAGNAIALAEVLEDLIRHPGQLVGYAEHIPKLKTISQNARELLDIYSQEIATPS